MAQVIELASRINRAPAGSPTARPEQIAHIDFHGKTPKVTRFAAGSERAQLFEELERLINTSFASVAFDGLALGWFLRFFRDNVEIGMETLLLATRWSHAINLQKLNIGVIETIMKEWRYKKPKTLEEWARPELVAWRNIPPDTARQRFGGTFSEIEDACNQRAPNTEDKGAWRTYALFLLLLRAYRESILANQ